jgi:uncharacterized protein (TIGR00159 family)
VIGFASSFLADLTLWQGVTAAVDILVVAYVIYRVLVLVKGTRAAQMLIGLVLVGAGFFLAKLFELTTLSWLLDNLINYSIIFLIVIFQHDIRRGLMRVGQNLFATGRKFEETYVFEEIIKAADTLGRARIGALIVLERDADLAEFLGDPGVVLDARVTRELLVSLFLPEPENTVHDGAVLIKNLRLFRAGCVLPLSANAKLDKQLGTRHRAAIGITEETDAVVVVVSEERGTVALCFNGNIAQDLDAATLRKALLGLFQKDKPRRRAGDVGREPTGQTRRTDPREPTGPMAVPPTSPTQQMPVTRPGAPVEKKEPLVEGAAASEPEPR